MRMKTPGYPYGWPQPAGAITYQLNGTQVGRGNTLNLQGAGITAIPGPDKLTYVISGGGGGGISIGDLVIGGTNNEVLFINGVGQLTDSPNFIFNESTIEFQVGDLTSGANETLISLNDGSGQVVVDAYNQFIVNGTVAFPGAWFTASPQNQQVILGDISNTNQHTTFSVNDAVSTTISNAALHQFGFNSQPNLIYLDYGNATYWIGARGSGNGTSIAIFDGGTDRNIEVMATNRFDVVSASNNSFLQVNPSAKTVYIGDNSSAFNSTKFTVDDTASTFTFKTSQWFMISSLAGNPVFAANNNVQQVNMGDVNQVANKTRLFVSDSAQQVYTIGNFPGAVLGKGFLTDFTAQNFAIGDLDGVGNHNVLYIQDGISTISVRTPGIFQVTNPSNSRFLSVDIASGVYGLGDVDNGANHTKLIVDDTGTLVKMMGPAGVTGFMVNFATGLTTIANVPTYANDAAATGAGLATGDLYKTTTGGITALNIVP